MYDSNAIADRIREIAKAEKLPMKQVLADAGLGYNTMTTYRTSMPKADNLAKIADRLDCSVDYLLGRTSDPKSHHPAMPTADDDFDPADHIIGVQVDVDDERRAQ